MVVQFGFSAGDFAAAITVLIQVIKAFDSLEGAKRQYTDSQTFLRGLKLVFEYLDRNQENLSDEMTFQAVTVCRAYDKLHNYLQEYTGFHSTEPSHLQVAFSTVKWSFSKLSGKVQEVKETAMEAVAILETMVVLELRDRIGELRSSSQGQTDALDDAAGKLDEVRNLTASLTKVSEENNRQLEDMVVSNNEQTAEMKEMHERIRGMEERINESQEGLAESLKELNKHIEEQRKAANEAEKERWAQLQEEVKEETQAVDNLKKSQETVQAGLQDSQKALTSMGKLTDNHQLQHAGEKVGAFGELFGLASGFGMKFGRSGKTERQPAARPQASPRAAAAQRSRPTASPPQRTPRPAPSMPLSPPPTRRAVSPVSPGSPRASLGRTSPAGATARFVRPGSHRTTVPQPSVATHPAEDDDGPPPPLPPRPCISNRTVTVPLLPLSGANRPPPPALPPRPSPIETLPADVDIQSQTLPVVAISKPRPPLPPRPTSLSAPATRVTPVKPTLPTRTRLNPTTHDDGRAKTRSSHERRDSAMASPLPRTVAEEDDASAGSDQLTFAQKMKQIEDKLRNM